MNECFHIFHPQTHWRMEEQASHFPQCSVPVETSLQVCTSVNTTIMSLVLQFVHAPCTVNHCTTLVCQYCILLHSSFLQKYHLMQQDNDLPRDTRSAVLKVSLPVLCAVIYNAVTQQCTSVLQWCTTVTHVQIRSEQICYHCCMDNWIFLVF